MESLSRVDLHRLLSPEFPVSGSKDVSLPPNAGMVLFPYEIYFLLSEEGQSVLLHWLSLK